MRQPICLVPVLAFALAAAATAQKERAFHLPAGDYRLGELLTQCEQALRAPISRSQVEGLDERRPLRLQHALELTPDGWQDVLASLLYAHDLVLVRDAAGTGHEVLPMPTGRAHPAWIAERAQVLTFAEFVARPDRQGPLQVTVQTTLAPIVAINALRPLAMSVPGGVTVVDKSPDLVVTGLAGAVRSALAALASNDPTLAAKLPMATPRPWPRTVPATPFTLPAGTHTLQQIVDALAAATGCNLLVAADTAAELTFATTTTIAGDAHVFEAALTALLWTQQVLVVGAARGQRLMLVRGVSMANRPAADQAVPMTPEEVLARPDLVAYAELRYTPRHVDMATFAPPVLQAARVAGRAAGAVPANLELLTTEHGLFLRGFTPELLPIVQAMFAADKAK